MLTFADSPTHTKADHDTLARICAEYAEMPGLTLTLWQASRLFGLETARCEQFLRLLVHNGVLRRHGNSFAHGSSGRLMA